jgi:hypothetical protein
VTQLIPEANLEDETDKSIGWAASSPKWGVSCCAVGAKGLAGPEFDRGGQHGQFEWRRVVEFRTLAADRAFAENKVRRSVP